MKSLAKLIVVSSVIAVALVMAGPASAKGQKGGTKAAKGGKAAAATQTFSGTVDATDATAGSLTVKDSTGTSKTFSVGLSCKLATTANASASLADFKKGDNVVVTYTEDGAILTATTVANPGVVIAGGDAAAGKAHKGKKH